MIIQGIPLTKEEEEIASVKKERQDAWIKYAESSKITSEAYREYEIVNNRYKIIMKDRMGEE